MKESPTEGGDKGVGPPLLQLDEIKTEPDNAQVKWYFVFFFLEHHQIIDFSYIDAGLLVEKNF